MIASIQRLLRRPLIVYVVFPVVVILALVWSQGLLTPAYDELYIVQPLILDARGGSLSLPDIVRAYNGQRIPLPLLTTIGLALLTDWDVRADLILNLGLIMAASALVIMTWRRLRLPTFAGAIWALLLCLLLTPAQFINFTFGFQKCIWLMMIGVYGASHAAARWPGRPVIWWIGALCASTATWSFLSGNVLWIVIPVGLWLAGERRLRPLIIWALFAALNIGLYLIGYSTSDVPVEQAPPLFTLERLLGFPLAFLGGPFSAQLNPLTPVAAQDVGQAAVIGALGIILLAVAVISALIAKTFDARRAAPWLMLILFSFGCAGLIVLGRALEPKNVITSRYTTLALPFWIGLIGLVTQTWFASSAHPRQRVVVALITALTLPILIVTFSVTFYKFAAHNTGRDRMLQCLLTLDGPDCPSLLIGEDVVQGLGVDLVINRVETLRQARLSAFAQPIVSDLRYAALRAAEAEAQASTRQVYTINGVIQPVLFMPAPASLDLRAYLSDEVTRVQFNSAAYLPHPQFIPGDSNRLLADGADFSLIVIDEAGAQERVFTATLAPVVRANPIPVTVDLSAYRGQIVTLRFETAARANPDYDWAMWVEPRLTGS